MARIVALALALLLVVLPGCGGGGGGADPVANPPPGPGPFSVGVAYLADAEVDEQVELYVADLDGDGFLKVSGQLVAGGDVTSFQWSPDRSRLAFLADKDTDDVVELYTVAAAGGTVARVSGPLVAGGDVSEFRWSPSSERLAYLADQEQDDLGELFTVSAQGGSSVQVSGAFQSGEGIRFYAWAPDSSRIAYVAEQEQAGVPELFTTLAAGGGNVKVSGPMVAGGSVKFIALSSSLAILRPIAWAPDASRIAYLANQDALDRYELFTSLAAGGGNARVNGPMAPLDLLSPSVYEFTWHPDSSRIAYAANELDNRQGEVFVAAPDGANRAQILDVVSMGVFANSLAWSPDGQSIAGCANSFGNWIGGALFVTYSSGPAVVYSPNSGVTFAWSPDSTRIALTGNDVRADEATDIYNTFGAPAVSSLAPDEALRHETLAWAPDSARVAYLTEDLHVSFPITSYGAERVTPLLHGTDRSVRKFQWAPDSLRLVYSADLNAAQQIELFISPRDAASRTLLTGPLVFGGQVLDFEVR